MALSLPTSSDVRRVRTRANQVVNAQFDMVRTPLLAWLGASDLAVNKLNDAVVVARTRVVRRRAAASAQAEKLQGRLNELPGELRDRLTTEELRKRYDEVADQARKTYTELAGRGEGTLDRIRRQPRVAKVLQTVEDAGDRFDRQIERVVDEVHDAGEGVFSRVSTDTRSVGERAARATEHVSGETSEAVTRISGEVAEEIEEVGDEAAQTTRGATRKAANRTAPRKPPAAKPVETTDSTLNNQ
jgi:heparin binding hemagglutinin HbhA